MSKDLKFKIERGGKGLRLNSQDNGREGMGEGASGGGRERERRVVGKQTRARVK